MPTRPSTAPRKRSIPPSAAAPGRSRCGVPNVERDAQRRVNIRVTDEIVTALNERRIVMAFEPVVEARSRDAAFYECLVRMEQDDGQVLLAPDIVPVAEKLGLIRLVDHRVLELVVAELAASPDVQLSLNISPDTTMDPDWWSLDRIADARPPRRRRAADRRDHRDRGDPGYRRRPRLRHPAEEFRQPIAIDDFGAGYTSFRNLRKLGVDIVKIDGAFVQNIARSADDRAFVQTLIDLARRLEIKTVAEWVQDEESAVMLREWGCDYIQGRLIGLASSQRPWAAAAGDGCCRRRAELVVPRQCAIAHGAQGPIPRDLFNATEAAVTTFVVTLSDWWLWVPLDLALRRVRRDDERSGPSATLPSSALSTCARAGPACPSSGGAGRRCWSHPRPAPPPARARLRQRFPRAAARTA